jgi:hypothetical protein
MNRRMIMIALSLAAIATLSMAVRAQYEIREAGTYLSPYEINGPKPAGFKDFKNFVLKEPRGKDPSELPMDAAGNVPLAGRITLTNGRHFRFTKATLIKGKSGAFEAVKFRTTRKDGVHFEFVGRFLEKPVQEKPGGDYTELRGILSKFNHNGLASKSYLSFSVFAIM